MPSTIEESDWKIFKEVRELARERLCDRAVEEIRRICADDSRSAFDRYRDVRGRLGRCERDLEAAFDDLRRSTALLRLRQFRALGLLQPEDIGRFGESFRRRIELE